MEALRVRTIVVAGTGTGIGKTHVACTLLRAWGERGEKVVGLKPVETGVEGPQMGRTDQERLERAAFHVKHQAIEFHVKHSPFRFVPPISAHLAARQAGIRIDLGRIRCWVEESRAGCAAVVETAGGLFSPLAPGLTNLDLALALRPARLLLVAPDRLGALHDVTATIGLATALGHPVDAVVLSEPAVPDASTGLNAGELAALGIADVCATFPRRSEDDPASLDAATRLLGRLVD